MPGFGGKVSQSQVQDLIAYLRSIEQAALKLRNAPGAEGCAVAPRTLAELRAWATPGAGPQIFPAGDATPAATPNAGIAADAATVQGITATVEQLVACNNAGDIMRQLALYTDARLRQAYPNGPTADLEAMAATPVPVSALSRVAVLNISDVRQLPDGRVTATVVLDNPAQHNDSLTTPTVNSQRDVAHLTFVQQDGRWLVDAVNR
jgi:hypothetical protein